MALRKREVVGNLKKKHQMAFFGEIALEGAVAPSQDILRNNKCHLKIYFERHGKHYHSL
jgi:hypothetical protein